jgi:hypothetical protein
MQFALVLYGQSRELRIGRQVAGGAQLAQEPERDLQVARTGQRESNIWSG